MKEHKIQLHENVLSHITYCHGFISIEHDEENDSFIVLKIPFNTDEANDRMSRMLRNGSD